MIRTLGLGLAALVALMHLWFLVLEMFLWEAEIGRSTFNMTVEEAATTATLAMQQGLYNGFLAAGLIWSSLIRPDQATALFFLGCVIVAGLYGAVTVSRKIAYVQAAPAALAVLALLIAPLP